MPRGPQYGEGGSSTASQGMKDQNPGGSQVARILLQESKKLPEPC